MKRSIGWFTMAVFMLLLAVSQVAWSILPHHGKKVASPTLDAQPYSTTQNAIVVYRNAPEFSIKLKSNPSTGYQWYLMDYPHHSIDPMSHQFYPSQSKRVGEPGYEIWVFKVLPGAFNVPEMIKLSLIYARPFEISRGSAKTFSIISAVHNTSHTL